MSSGRLARAGTSALALCIFLFQAATSLAAEIQAPVAANATDSSAATSDEAPSSNLAGATPSSQSLSDFLEPAYLKNFVTREIAKQNISLSAQLFDASIMNGVSEAIGIRYQVEPSYINSFYTRYDEWVSDLGVDPSAWVKQLGSPFAFGLSAKSSLIFARQFKTQKEAASALSYTPLRLPTSAERALKLEIGDFVSFKSDLSLIAGIGTFTPTALSLTGATHAILTGTFMVHVYKRDKTHIRLKLIGIREAEGNAEATAEIDRRIRLIALKISGKTVTKYWDLTLGTANARLNLSDVTLLDYILDLSNPEVAKAYDDLVQTKVVLKSGRILLPALKDLKNSKIQPDPENADLLSDLTALERLYQRDLNLPRDQRTVDRIFSGSTLTTNIGKTGKLNLVLIRNLNDTYFAQNKIETTDGKETHYLLDSFSHLKDRSTLFHFADRTETINTNLLFTADEKFSPKRFIALVLSREIRRRTVSRSEIEEIQKQLQKVLPSSIYQLIPWYEWRPQFDHAVNIFFRHQIYFPLDAINAMPSYDIETLRNRYAEFLKTIPEPSAYPLPVQVDDPEVQGRTYRPRSIDRYDDDIELIAEQLAIAFNPKLAITPRYEAFVKLKDNALFQETGAGFLISLLPQDSLNRFLGYSLELNGAGLPPIDFHYGSASEDEIYRSMLYIQDILNNRSVDLRLLKQTSEGAPGSASVTRPIDLN